MSVDPTIPCPPGAAGVGTGASVRPKRAHQPPVPVCRDERGAVALVFAAVFLPLLLTLSAVALDFSAARIDRARLQTAADAAALAAVTESDERADITVRFWQEHTHRRCTASDRQGRCTAWEEYRETHWGATPLLGIMARDAETVARAAVPPDWNYGGYSVDRKWSELRSAAAAGEASRAAWRANARWVAGAAQPEIQLHPGGNGTNASADVTAEAERPTGILRLFGVRWFRERVESAAIAEPQ